jgi:dihydroneopterin aldolase
MLCISIKQKITLGFRELSVDCSIGVLPHELAAEQKILISLEVDIEIEGRLQSDRLEETVDYAALMKRCVEVAKKRHFRLMETLAQEILCTLGEEFPLLRAQITIEKPSALALARASFVRMEHEWPGH